MDPAFLPLFRGCLAGGAVRAEIRGGIREAQYSITQIRMRIPQIQLQPLPYGRGSACSLVQSRDRQGAVAAEYVGELMKWSS